MSIRAKLFYRLYWLSGIKKIYSLPKDEFEAKVAKINSKRGFKMPKDNKAKYEDLLIFDKYHCLIIKPKEKEAKKAVLFIFGGGMILDSDAEDIKLARKIANDCRVDIYFPYYPLCLEHNIKETYDMVFECYRQMIEVYGGGNVSTMGFSSGGALAIGVSLHNNATGAGLPQPKEIIAISPGECPWSEKEHKLMRELNKKDPAVDYNFMATVENYMRHGEDDVPDYMISGSRGDFSGINKIYFYYSSDEILYAVKDSFIEACERYDVDYNIDAKEGMVHCYCLLPFTPEGKRKLKEIEEIIKN